jgi:hypothetical protein
VLTEAGHVKGVDGRCLMGHGVLNRSETKSKDCERVNGEKLFFYRERPILPPPLSGISDTISDGYTVTPAHSEIERCTLISLIND